ncbi:MAG TPA: hypothetical protein VMG14_04665 [Thermoplasmata archaeon]|nr:hypothetical protein [Thermoplasmata archaeon]
MPLDSTPAAAIEAGHFPAALRAAGPLIVVAIGLSVSSLVALEYGPGTGPFPLWGMLVTLAGVAAIGATVSGLSARRTPTPAPTTPPTRTGAAIPVPGRPSPEAQRPIPYRPAAVWDESTVVARPVAVPVRPCAIAVDPEPDDVERALDEIAEIEAELGMVPDLAARTSGAPARS